MIVDLIKNILRWVVPLGAAYGIVLALISTGVINNYLFATMMTICINIILATSLNLVVGFTGQLALGHAGFMAIGAYTCAIITMRVDGVVFAILIAILIVKPTGLLGKNVREKV